MVGSKAIKSIKDITLIAVLTTILFVQEQLLSSIPGVQLTVFLIILYSKKCGLAKALIIVVLHVVLDNLFMGSFSLMYTPTMLIGCIIIPLTICTLFKKVESSIFLGLLGMAYSFIYCWLFIIPNYIFFRINPLAYFISDVLFEVILAVFSFISISLLYKPCAKAIDLIQNEKYNDITN